MGSSCILRREPLKGSFVRCKYKLARINTIGKLNIGEGRQFIDPIHHGEDPIQALERQLLWRSGWYVEVQDDCIILYGKSNPQSYRCTFNIYYDIEVMDD